MSRTMRHGSSSPKSRQMKALKNGTYDVPILTLSDRLRRSVTSNTVDSQFTKPNQPSMPAYCDSNGRWWDYNYVICNGAPECRELPVKEGEPPLSAQHLLAVIQGSPCPDPASFDRYTDYELALLKWKDHIEAALLSADVTLPVQQGRHYHRPPFHPRYFKKILKQKQLQTSSMNVGNNLSGNSSGNLFSNHSDSILNTSSASQISNPLLQSTGFPQPEYGTLHRDPWESILIPTEPNPADFDVFEDYESAMKRWAFLVSQNTAVLPLHASQLPQVIPMAAPMTQTQVKTSEYILGPIIAPKTAGLPLLQFWDPLNHSIVESRSSIFIRQSHFLTSLDDHSSDEEATEDMSSSDGHGGADNDAHSLSSSQHLAPSSSSKSIPRVSPRAIISRESAINDIEAGFDALITKANQNKQKNGFYYTQSVTGQLRGTFPQTFSSQLPLSPRNISPSNSSVTLANANVLSTTTATTNSPATSSAAPISQVASTTSSVVLGQTTTIISPTFTYDGIFKASMLRRTDLTPVQIESSHDCPPIVDGRQVQFNFPATDIANVNIRSLIEDPQYREDVKKHVMKLHYHADMLPCFSWYQKSTLKQQQSDADMLRSLAQSSTISMEALKAIMFSNLDLDIMNDVLSEYCIDPMGIKRVIGEYLANTMKLKEFPHFLTMMEDTQEQRIHARIGHFALTVLQFNKASEYVQYLVSNGAFNPEKNVDTEVISELNAVSHMAHLASSSGQFISSPRPLLGTLRRKQTFSGPKFLSLLAYALNFTQTTRLDIFPYSKELVSIGTQIIGHEYKEMIDTIFVFYYVKIIHTILEHKNKLGGFNTDVNIYGTLNVAATSLLGYLHAYPALIRTMMVEGIGSRSRTVSALFTFLTLQILHCEDKISMDEPLPAPTPRGSRHTIDYTPRDTITSSVNSTVEHSTNQQLIGNLSAIKRFVRSSEVNILGAPLKFLASSKFSHAKFACKRLMNVLASPGWLTASLHQIESSVSMEFGPFDHIVNPEPGSPELYFEALLMIIQNGMQRATDLADLLFHYPNLATATVVAPYDYEASTLSSQNSTGESSSMSLQGTNSSSPSTNPVATSASSTSFSSSAPNPTILSSTTGSSSSPTATSSSLTAGIPNLSFTKPHTSTMISYAQLSAHYSASISFLTTNFVFEALLNSCCGSSMFQVTHSTQFAANVLALLSRAFVKLRLIRTPSMESVSSSSSKHRSTDRSMVIGLPQIQNIVHFLASANGWDLRAVQSSKTHLLRCLRHLLKLNSVFDLVKNELELHQILGHHCRNPPMSTNVEAWKCLYQMTKYHPTTMDCLVKSKFINYYFEGFGSYGGPSYGGASEKSIGLFMTQNALKYLTKILSLSSSTSSNSPTLSKQSSSSPNSTSDSIGQLESPRAMVVVPISPLKPSSSSNSTNANIKPLTQYIINNHMFIKFHVIFKKLSELDCGSVYAELISFYHAILTLPSCKKLLKAASKVDSFREGLAAVSLIGPLLEELKRFEAAEANRKILLIPNSKTHGKGSKQKDDSPTSPRKKDKLSKDEKKKQKKLEKDRRRGESHFRTGKSGFPVLDWSDDEDSVTGSQAQQ